MQLSEPQLLSSWCPLSPPMTIWYCVIWTDMVRTFWQWGMFLQACLLWFFWALLKSPRCSQLWDMLLGPKKAPQMERWIPCQIGEYVVIPLWMEPKTERLILQRGIPKENSCPLSFLMSVIPITKPYDKTVLFGTLNWFSMGQFS